MGLFSGWFGGNKEERALRAAFEKIRRVIEDEEFQLELLPPPLQSILKTCAAYDMDPRGTGPFGYTETNPIPVNGPIGELAYLSKIETEQGERILFHRIGAVDKVDVFEAVTFSGAQWFILFVDMYKGVGADCVGFVRGVAEPFVGRVPIAMDYTTTWQLYRAEPRMYREFAARCEELPLARIKPGDILLFGFGKGPAHHCGYAAPGSRIIHCYREAGAVVEQDLTDWWRTKLRHAFRVPDISEGSF